MRLGGKPVHPRKALMSLRRAQRAKSSIIFYLLRGSRFCRTLKACVHHLGLLLEGAWFSGTLKTFGNQLDLPLEGARFYRALKTLWNGHGHPGGNYVLEMLDKFRA